MTDYHLEQKLAQAVEHAAPDQLDAILDRCGQRRGPVVVMQQTPRRRRSFSVYAVAACLALLLLGGGGLGFYRASNAVASVVSLDVNPSIEMQVNGREKVLSVAALNAEAEEVLADLPLKGTDLNVAVNAVIGSLLRHGYLDSISSAILISVEDSDANRAARLQQSLSTEVGTALQNAQSGAAVLSQTVTQDAGLDSLAQQNSVSVGKAYLIESIRGVNSALGFDELAALSVEELKQMASAGAGQMPIGREQAAAIARAYAGVEAGASLAEVDPELDEYPPHYEVELKTAFGEYEYIIDGYTGEVLSGAADIQTNPGGATTPSTPDTSGGQQPSGADIGLDAAKSAALTHAGGAASQALFPQTERDYDDGRLEYELEFWVGETEYDYEVDGATGRIIKSEAETHMAASQGDIGLEAARDAALRHAGLSLSQVRGLETERDYDDGRLEYEIQFYAGGMEYEYTIDGATGTVLEYEMDED